MPLSDTIKTLIRNAWDDEYPCLVATDGIGRAQHFGQGQHDCVRRHHLAYWERSKRTALDNLPGARQVARDVLDQGAVRRRTRKAVFRDLLCSVALHESGSNLHGAIFANVAARADPCLPTPASAARSASKKAIDIRGSDIYDRTRTPVRSVAISACAANRRYSPGRQAKRWVGKRKQSA